MTLTGVDKFAGQQIWARFSAPHRGSGTRMYRCQTQAARYIQGLPDGLPRWANPLPFSYQSTGTDKFAGQQIWARFSAPRRGSGTRTYRCQTRFTNGLDPAPRSRPVFAFHKPETLAAWLEDARITPSPLAGEKQTIPSPSMGEGEGGGEYLKAANTAADYRARGQTVLARLQHMPPLKEAGLWPAQIKAINNLEQSLKENRPRALIQMGERRVKEPRTPAQGCAGRTTSKAGLRSEVTGSSKILDESKFNVAVKGDSPWE